MTMKTGSSKFRTPTVSYTRGNDVSGTMEGAGGIGGLLARSSGYSIGNFTTHNYYFCDGNGKDCKKLLLQISANHGASPVPKGGKCPPGSHEIAVYSDGNGGYWSEMSKNPTYPPRKCQKGSDSGKPCGDLCAPDQP